MLHIPDQRCKLLILIKVVGGTILLCFVAFAFETKLLQFPTTQEAKLKPGTVSKCLF